MFIIVLISTVQLLATLGTFGVCIKIRTLTSPWLIAGPWEVQTFLKASEWSPQHWHQNLPLSSSQFCHKGLCLFVEPNTRMSCETCLVWAKSEQNQHALESSLDFGNQKRIILCTPIQPKTKENPWEVGRNWVNCQNHTVPKWLKKEVRWVGITTAICSKLSTANILFFYAWFQ